MKKILYFVLFLGILLGLYNYYPESTLPTGVVIDKLVLHKSKHELWAYSGENLMKVYRVSLGEQPVGRKETEGDFKTPEGIYSINAKNPKSSFYKNLGISYPNEEDVKAAVALGKSAGSDIKIHGLNVTRAPLGRLHRLMDWTAGCIALTNREIDERYNAVPVGAVIEMKP
jgi:murein L,D-transpeptidase YafK